MIGVEAIVGQIEHTWRLHRCAQLHVRGIRARAACPIPGGATAGTPCPLSTPNCMHDRLLLDSWQETHCPPI
eukprot:3976845-Alexandrium_andersonii.AAC.1